MADMSLEAESAARRAGAAEGAPLRGRHARLRVQLHAPRGRPGTGRLHEGGPGLLAPSVSSVGSRLLCADCMHPIATARTSPVLRGEPCQWRVE